MRLFQDACILRVQQLQRDAFARNLSDIPYNFLIGDDGNTYEARGFNYFGEIVTNNTKIEIGIVLAFIGTFIDRSPSQRQITVYNAFLEKSLRQGYLSRNYSIVVEDQLTNSNLRPGLHDVVGESERFRECE
jgi:peptidoglycan recognition protein LD